MLPPSTAREDGEMSRSKSRMPIWIALIVLGLVLIGGLVYLIASQPKHDDSFMYPDGKKNTSQSKNLSDTDVTDDGSEY